MQISGNVFGAGLTGVQRGFSQLDQSAQRVASGSIGTDNQNVDKGLLELPGGKTQVQASAKVLDVADSTLGTLLDIRA